MSPNTRRARLVALLLLACLFSACSSPLTPAPSPSPRAAASVAVAPTAAGFEVSGADWPGLTEVTLGLEPANPGSSGAPLALGKVTTNSQGRLHAAFTWTTLAGRLPSFDQPYQLVALADGLEARTPFDLTPPTPAAPATATALPIVTATPTAVPATNTPTAASTVAETPTSPPTATPSAAPTLTPTPWPAVLAIAPLQGWAGSAVTASGVNWPPGRKIVANLAAPGQPPAADLYAQGTVNTQGRFTLSFSFPNQERWLSLPQVEIIVRTEDGLAQAAALFRLARPTPTVTPTPKITAWRGEYFANRSLSGAPAFTRNDEKIEFNWGAGSPDRRLPNDNFSVRWTRTLPFEAGDYRFYARSDDGLRLWLDGWLVIEDWNDGGRLRTGDFQNLGAGNHALRIEYFESAGDAYQTIWWQKVGPISDWRGEYFPNPRLEGAPTLTRNDRAIDFDWGAGPPAPDLPADNFSARWARTLPLADGRYRFTVQVDDGMRLWLDNHLLSDQWREGSTRTFTAETDVAAGNHTLRLEYLELGGGALIELTWQRIGDRAAYNPRLSIFELDLARYTLNGADWPPGAIVSIAVGRARPGGIDMPDLYTYLGDVRVEGDGRFAFTFAKLNDLPPNLVITAVSGDYRASVPYPG